MLNKTWSVFVRISTSNTSSISLLYYRVFRSCSWCFLGWGESTRSVFEGFWLTSSSFDSVFSARISMCLSFKWLGAGSLSILYLGTKIGSVLHNKLRLFLRVKIGFYKSRSGFLNKAACISALIDYFYYWSSLFLCILSISSYAISLKALLLAL